MRIYIDTNVYLDYFLERKKSTHAFKIFKKTLSCKFQIIVSNHVLRELSNMIEYSDVTFIFEMLKRQEPPVKDWWHD
jgi:predicted nucleic acid-binding protein